MHKPLTTKNHQQFSKETPSTKILAFIAQIDKSCIHFDKKKGDSDLSKIAKISVIGVSLSSGELCPNENYFIFM
jgi:hypothetical protein